MHEKTAEKREVKTSVHRLTFSIMKSITNLNS